MRKEYTQSALSESQLQQRPIDQFKIWFDECIERGIPEPNAMVLSTVGPDQKPSSRVVLLKNYQEEGFVFFTNYQSRKGHELQFNAHACLLFFWDKLERQVRIEGVVSQLSEKLSDEYFYSRPVLSQIGAMISPQSQEISSREELIQRVDYYTIHPEEIKRPKHWGGYLLTPEYFEFWQGRENRLHDRFIYERKETEWRTARIAP